MNIISNIMANRRAARAKAEAEAIAKAEEMARAKAKAEAEASAKAEIEIAKKTAVQKAVKPRHPLAAALGFSFPSPVSQKVYAVASDAITIAQKAASDCYDKSLAEGKNTDEAEAEVAKSAVQAFICAIDELAAKYLDAPIADKLKMAFSSIANVVGQEPKH